MKPYSITRRLVVIVLLVQLLLTGAATAVSLLYEHNQMHRAFDVMLRGRADSVFAAVQDAEDAADNVAVDTAALDLPRSDLYQVLEEPSGRVVGRSSNWQGIPLASLHPSKPIQEFATGGKHYRAILLHGVRVVDSEGGGPGISRKVVVFYAAPTGHIRHELWEAARALTVFNSLLLLVTGLVLVFLLRRSMAPLNALAVQAAMVSPRSWHFEAPPEARSAAELSSLVNALETVLKRLERSFVQQQVFVNDAAHELKTAVTVIKSSLQLLDYRERSVPDYRSGLRVCLADCERMEELVQRLLTLARAEQLAGNREPAAPAYQTSLSDGIREAIAQLESVARMRQVSVEYSSSAQPLAAISAEDFLTVAKNLLLNAIQHSPAGSRIEVDCAAVSSTQARILIRDHGEGIPPEHLPFVFERFYRGDASRSRQTGGTGLGLAICQAIVEAYAGHIAITSELGKGTAVTVELPLAPLSGPTILLESTSASG